MHYKYHSTGIVVLLYCSRKIRRKIKNHCATVYGVGLLDGPRDTTFTSQISRTRYRYVSLALPSGPVVVGDGKFHHTRDGSYSRIPLFPITRPFPPDFPLRRIPTCNHVRGTAYYNIIIIS